MTPRVPLHIGAGVSVTLDDGPSLVMELPGKTPLRAPIERCSRVVSDCSVRLGGEVLIACMRAGIPWVWRDQHGLAGTCLPASTDPWGWRDWVLGLLSRDDWRACYESWCRAQRHLAIRSLAVRFGLAWEECPENRWWPLFWAHVGVRAKWSEWAMRQWKAMAVSLMLECWVEWDIPADALAEPSLAWMPVIDLGGCLGMDMAADLARRKRHWREVRAMPMDKVHRELALAFEQRRTRLIRLAAALQRRFQKWLLEMQQWR